MVEGCVRSDGVGIAGVACSDGRSVVLTGADGNFELDPAGPHVFVSVPSGQVTDRWYLPADASELSFELRRQVQPARFTFAQVTDFHLSLGDRAFGDGDATMYLADGAIRERIVTTPSIVARLFEDIADGHPDLAFVISTGDQTNTGTDAELAAYAELAAASPLRIINIAGNHDHNSVDPDAARREGERFGPDVLLTPYDRFIGPRWFSFSWGGVHFVAIDWTTHHLGLDAEVQEAWVRADLACVASGTPVIFLTHDLMQTSFWDATGATPVASFSGHWHTSRVVASRGALHVNSSPATFGGLDYSPAHYRIVTWDGERVSVSSVSRGQPWKATDADASWSVQLRHDARRAGPVVYGDLVLAASGDEDGPAGSVEAFEIGSGERRWSCELGSAVKSAPRVCGDRVVATAVTGETVCIDASTGAEHWRTEIDDSLRLWTYLRPATDSRLVFVGDTARFVALDLADGSVVWRRDDLGRRGNITCHAHPVVVDGTLMVSFAAQVPDMWALDAATGEIRWPADGEAASIYDLGGEALPLHLPRVPMAGFGVDPSEPDVYVVRLGKQLDRIRAEDGSVVWSSRIGGWFNPATPIVDTDDVFVCEGMGTVWCLSRTNGEVRWTSTVTQRSPVHMGPYRDEGGALFGEPLVTATQVIVACGDGRVVTLSRSDGRMEAEVDLGVPVAAPPAIAGRTCLVVGIDGVLRALPL